MQKWYIAIIICLLIFLSACGNHLNPDWYPNGVGKDTVLSFGDGTYQVLHQNVDGDAKRVLTNTVYNQCVLTEVKNYVQNNEFIYFTGNYYSKKVYCKLNTETNLLLYFAEDNEEEFIMVYLEKMQTNNQIKILSSYDEYSEFDKSIFDKIYSE